MVASIPVDSAIRRAARPVGATSVIDARCCLAAAQISRIVAVLPVPGPPVTIERREANAASTAAHCSGAGTSSVVAGAETAVPRGETAGALGGGPSGGAAGSSTDSARASRRTVSASSASKAAVGGR